MKLPIAILLFFAVFVLSVCEGKDKNAGDFFDRRVKNDVKAVLLSRQGLADTVAFMRSRPNLFPPEKTSQPALMTREERIEIWQTWQTFLDYLLALDSLGQLYADLDYHEEEQKKTAFRIAYAIFLAQYRYALDFITLAEEDEALHTVLNEPVPELGLPEGTYSQIKYRFLNVIRGGEFVRLNVVYDFYGQDPQSPLTANIEEDKAAIWKAGRGTGPLLTVQNAFRILHDSGFTAWFPVQKGVSQWMGDTKVWRQHRALITQEQIEAMRPVLKPGDILLERREWYVSNVGLPGYWPHAALYMGTPKERKKFFDDPEVTAWVKEAGEPSGDFEKLLEKRYPEAYQAGITPQDDRHAPRVIEAISQGVAFTTLEHSAAADSLAVLRPRLPKVEKAQALVRAFHFSGRPYDFNFDFLTDAALVCTEVIYKAYEPATGFKGLTLPVKDVLGRPVTPPNDIAVLFDEEYGLEQQQFDMVLFLDGNEYEKKSVVSDVASFRQSWRRPKWHIFLPVTDGAVLSKVSKPLLLLKEKVEK